MFRHVLGTLVLSPVGHTPDLVESKPIPSMNPFCARLVLSHAIVSIKADISLCLRLDYHKKRAVYEVLQVYWSGRPKDVE